MRGIIRGVVITRRVIRRTKPVACTFAKDFMVSTATSSATDFVLHHKAPQMSVVLDVATCQCIGACIKLFIHI